MIKPSTLLLSFMTFISTSFLHSYNTVYQMSFSGSGSHLLNVYLTQLLKTEVKVAAGPSKRDSSFTLESLAVIPSLLR